VALVGDVALAHDIGGLLAASRLGLSLTVVVINNDGGGIFEFLPVASQEGFYEEHVATPHGLDLARAAELYDLHFERPPDEGALARSLGAALARRSSTLIEVRTDRRANRELLARCEAAVCRALAAGRQG
jgi:2-succinyl-5-enolpyruvyl-6-hydroxy-3-cyclohexene-1-carboxylate synthase